MTTIIEYREALADLRRFISDPEFRNRLAKDVRGFGLSPQDILIEELATIGLRFLEARAEPDLPYKRAREALELIGSRVNEEGCEYTVADFIIQFADAVDDALAIADAATCCWSLQTRTAE